MNINKKFEFIVIAILVNLHISNSDNLKKWSVYVNIGFKWSRQIRNFGVTNLFYLVRTTTSQKGTTVKESHDEALPAEKVCLNKQMSPARIEIILGDPTYKCPLQESLLFWDTTSPSTNIFKYTVVLSTTKLV